MHGDIRMESTHSVGLGWVRREASLLMILVSTKENKPFPSPTEPCFLAWSGYITSWHDLRKHQPGLDCVLSPVEILYLASCVHGTFLSSHRRHYPISTPLVRDLSSLHSIYGPDRAERSRGCRQTTEAGKAGLLSPVCCLEAPAPVTHSTVDIHRAD